MLRLLIACLVLSLGPPLLALTPDQAQKMYDRITPSLVVVQYTMDGEFGRRELIGQGVVVGEDGLVMTSMSMFPITIPDEQMTEFKIIVPGDEEKELDAIFLGRDERSDMAFLKTRQPQKWQPIRFEEAPLRIADPILSVGLLPKEAGYKAYYTEAFVSALLRGPVPYVLASPGGLTTIGSPVFNAEGKAIGFVPYCQQGPPPWLNRNSGALQNLNAPPRLFVPAHDFLPSLKQPPTGQPLKIPWLGAVLAGLNKEVADYYNLKNVPVAQVGEVIPNSPAHKAGLKTGDKIVKVNAQPLERGDEPDETSAILIRKIRRMNVGDKVSLTVLREKDRPTTDLPVTLEEQPKQANLAKRYYADDLGMTMREIVFSDTYAKKVPADTPGVVVAFVRQGSSANSAGLRAGDLVSQLNKEPIADLAGFKQQYKDFRQKDPKALVVLVVIREQKTEVIKIEPPQ